jgi:hypothetical protein
MKLLIQKCLYQIESKIPCSSSYQKISIHFVVEELLVDSLLLLFFFKRALEYDSGPVWGSVGNALYCFGSFGLLARFFWEA